MSTAVNGLAKNSCSVVNHQSQQSSYLFIQFYSSEAGIIFALTTWTNMGQIYIDK